MNPVNKIIGGAVDYTVQNRLAEKAFQRNRDFYWETWNATNQYNSPVQVMARMKEAGLNPALMYAGAGGPAGGAPASQGDTPQRSTPAWNRDSALSWAQQDLLDKQGEKADAEIKLSNTNSALATERAATEKKKQLQIDYLNAKTDAERESIRQRLKYADRLSEMSLAFQEQQIKNLQAQEMKTTAEFERLDATKIYYIAQEKKKLDVMSSQINMNKALSSQAEAETALKRLDAVIKSVKADMARNGIDATNQYTLLGSSVNSVLQKADDIFMKFRGLEPRRWLSADVMEMYNNWRTKK